MRKFLTAIMAVLMIASAFAMLPTGAATATTYDKTTSSNVPSSLVVTEFACDTTSDTTGQETQDAFEFIEIYNRGSAVSLYDYCLLRGDNTSTGSIWRSSHGFNKQMFLTSGTIYQASHVDGGLWGKDSSSPNTTQTTFRANYNYSNPGTASLAQGKFALIWFYNDQTAQCAQQEGRALTKTDFTEQMLHYSKEWSFLPSLN